MGGGYPPPLRTKGEGGDPPLRADRVGGYPPPPFGCTRQHCSVGSSTRNTGDSAGNTRGYPPLQPAYGGVGAPLLRGLRGRGVIPPQGKQGRGGTPHPPWSDWGHLPQDSCNKIPASLAGSVKMVTAHKTKIRAKKLRYDFPGRHGRHGGLDCGDRCRGGGQRDGGGEVKAAIGLGGCPGPDERAVHVDIDR